MSPRWRHKTNNCKRRSTKSKSALIPSRGNMNQKKTCCKRCCLPSWHSVIKVKDELIHLIINKYSASSAPYEDYDKLENAFGAIEFKHTDGEPVQVKGHPYLYVGHN